MRCMSDRELITRLTQIAERKGEIITLQTGVINTLLSLLSMYISSEDLDSLPVIKDINEAAEIRREMEGL